MRLFFCFSFALLHLWPTAHPPLALPPPPSPISSPSTRWWQARLPPIWETQTVTLRAIMRIENMRTGWIWWSQAVSPCTGGSRAGFCS